jgi:hypothetical protein
MEQGESRHMNQLVIKLNGDNAWPDLQDKDVIHIADGGPPIQVAILDHGMTSGRPSVAIRIDIPDGRTIIAETTARLFCNAAKAFMAKYPDLFIDH